MLVYLLFRHALPADGWKMLAALSATWTGGSANLVAVKQSIGLPDNLLPSVLLADALCYSVWVVVLFSAARFAPAFNRWTRRRHTPAPLPDVEPHAVGAASPGSVLLWLGAALLVGNASTAVAAHAAGQRLAHRHRVDGADRDDRRPGRWRARPLARSPVPAPLASAMLACLVAVLASQSNFAGLATAPLFVAVGFCVLLLHVALLAAARAPVPLRPVPVRDLLAGADRRRGDRAGACRHLFARAGAGGGAAGDAGPGAGHGHRPVDGRAAVRAVSCRESIHATARHALVTALLLGRHRIAAGWRANGRCRRRTGVIGVDVRATGPGITGSQRQAECRPCRAR